MSEVKSITGVDAVYGDNFPTKTADESKLVVNLTGKYELLAIRAVAQTYTSNFAIQIDGSANRKTIDIPKDGGTLNVVGLNLRCESSMKITCNSTATGYVSYRLLT